MYFKSLDNAITLYLRQSGKTQGQLAREVGMAENTFSWKRRGANGKEFSLDEIRTVAKVIGMTSFDDLLSDFVTALTAVA